MKKIQILIVGPLTQIQLQSHCIGWIRIRQMFESKFCHSFESKHQKNWFPPEVTEGAKDEVKKPKGPPTRSLDL